MHEGSNNLKIVQAILMLSHRLGVGVIAEGVETELQLLQLRQLGCEYGQGFYLSVPLPGSDLRNLLVDTKTGKTNLFMKKLKTAHIAEGRA